MRKFVKRTVKNAVLDKVICNMCGEVIVENNATIIDRKDYLAIRKYWGYDSNKDGERHGIDLCESCYDAFAKSLRIPPSIKNPR